MYFVELLFVASSLLRPNTVLGISLAGPTVNLIHSSEPYQVSQLNSVAGCRLERNGSRQGPAMVFVNTVKGSKRKVGSF
jgi:hypothetical protein